MKFTRKTGIIVASVAAAVIVGVVVVKSRAPKVSYETEKVARGTVIEDVSVTGSLASTQKISLEPEVTGRIVKRNVDEGTVVKQGDVLAEIDSRDLQAKIASQRAAVDSAKAQLAQLVAGSTSEEIALAEAAVATAESKRQAAVAAKADADTALKNAQTNYDNVVAKADTLSANKLETLQLDYDKAVVDAKDAVDHLSGPMFTNDNQLTFTSTSFIASTNAISTRVQARGRLPELTAAVAAAKAAGTLQGTSDAYATVVADLTTAKSHLEADREVLNYPSGLSPTTLSTYQENVSIALTTLNATLQTLNGDKSALDLQVRLNQSDVTAAQIALSNAQAALTSATFAIDTSVKAVAQAQADLDIKKTGSRPEVIASQRAQVEVAEAAMTGLLTDLAKRSITSPIDGIVTEVLIEVGETVGPGKTAVALQTKGNFEITTNISEIDIGKVIVGDPVTITLDAFPKSVTWTGKVVSIHPAEKVVEGVIFYETKIVFDNEDPRLRSGMTANLIIQTAKKDGVLRVPLRALRETRDKTTVQVMKNGAPVETEVKVGLENNTHAEAISGLAEGDEVVVAETKK